LNRCLRAAIGIVALVCLVPGCGSNTADPVAAGKPVEAGPNSRIKFKEEYKDMIGKDGQLRWKPSESKKRPPGVPKS
jgi:hypothetical protein